VEGVRFDGDNVVDADQVRTAWLEHQVVLFPGLDPTPEEHLALAQALGTPEVHGDSDDDSRTYRPCRWSPRDQCLPR
jgi:alpha-ketoglutarate-dependent taurine dioxygenase